MKERVMFMYLKFLQHVVGGCLQCSAFFNLLGMLLTKYIRNKINQKTNKTEKLQ